MRDYGIPCGRLVGYGGGGTPGLAVDVRRPVLCGAPSSVAYLPTADGLGRGLPPALFRCPLHLVSSELVRRASLAEAAVLEVMES